MNMSRAASAGLCSYKHRLYGGYYTIIRRCIREQHTVCCSKVWSQEDFYYYFFKHLFD